MMLLVGGGIGVTPVMGMLKDIYDVGLPNEMQHQQQHCIDTIYFMWVMPHLTDYDLFRLGENLWSIVVAAVVVDDVVVVVCGRFTTR